MSGERRCAAPCHHARATCPGGAASSLAAGVVHLDNTNPTSIALGYGLCCWLGQFPELDTIVSGSAGERRRNEDNRQKWQE